MSAPRYMPQLDGVRGVAVLAVVLFHYRPRLPGGATFNAGWTGVDLFFVLSGFLCTRILTSQETTWRAALRFVARRALRTWPAYFTALLAVSLLASVPWQYWVYGQSYANATIRPLGHTWSLAVEEHFYLALPLVCVLGRRVLPFVLVVAIFISFSARHGFLADFDAPSAYRLTHARLDALAVGGLLALYHEHVSRWLAWTGIVVLVASLAPAQIIGEPVLVLDALGPWFGAALPLGLAIGFASLVWLVVHEPLVGQLFSAKWLKELGRVSYGVYLYNFVFTVIGAWIVIPAICRAGVPYPQAQVGAIAIELLATYATVTLSWRHLETPFLRLKSRLT